MMAAINFANACMSVSAQPDCAAFACPATTNIAIILDVSNVKSCMQNVIRFCSLIQSSIQSPITSTKLLIH